MVHDGGPVGLHGLKVEFDDERAASDAGVVLCATLAERLGLAGLIELCVRMTGRLGGAHPSRKMLSLMFAMVLGADCIDDTQVLRSGRTGRLLGISPAAPSTLGTFLRAFTFGHARAVLIAHYPQVGPIFA